MEATSALNKEEVSVVWTAPPVGSGCIMLKAMVVERNDFWFMDDGALTYHICEDDSPMATPPVVEPCTACDEAKYEVQCFTIMGKYEVHYFIIMGNYEVENFTIMGDEVI